MNDATLSLIVPAYNAATSLPALVQACLIVLPHLFADVEIVIVDDASTDATPRIADALAAAHEPVVVLHQQVRCGFGAALAHGVGAARGDYIGVAASSEPRAADGIALLAPALAGAALLAGIPAGYNAGPLGQALDALFGDWPHGAEHGVLIASSSLLRTLPLTSRSRLVLAEIVWRAQRAGSRVATLPLPAAHSADAPIDAGDLLRLRVPLARAERGAAGPLMRRSWRQKALAGGALAALAGGIYMARRRR